MKYIILLSLLLTGCATHTTTEKMQQVIIDEKTEKTYIFPDQNVLKSCEELPLPSGKRFKDTYNDLIKYSELYYKCSNNKDELSKWIENFKNEVEKK